MNPATEKQTPLERQLTVVVAWLAHHSERFARELLRQFFAGDDEALAALSQDDIRVGSRTWGTLRPVQGVTGSLYPDIVITASGRAFELIVEMKVDAAVHQSGVLDGKGCTSQTPTRTPGSTTTTRRTRRSSGE